MSTTGAKLVVVDSVALASGEAQEDAAVVRYFSALRSLDAASLSIAHVAHGRKDSPFGSVYWVNIPQLSLQDSGGIGGRQSYCVGVDGHQGQLDSLARALSAWDIRFDLDEVTISPGATLGC